MDGYMMWCQIIMPQQLRNLKNTSPELACTDDLFGLYLVDLRLLCCHSSLELYGNQLQQLPTGVFSSLTSLRSLTCVVACIENVCVHVCV
jgi:hypothetical protein